VKVRSRVEFEEAGGAVRGSGPAEGPTREARDRHLAQLIAGVAGGDAQALRELHALTVGRVYGIALRIVRTKEAAEEVAIDAFLQVWRTASTYDPLRGGPLAWLLTIARSRALDYLRRAEPAEAHPDPAVLAPAEALARGDDPQDLLLAVEGQAALMRALEQLSALQRQLIALAFFRGLTHQEIAEHARLPLGSVKTYIRRALAQLRAQLGTLH
jgi:RNA polymerase sigma factor (sigma-70 family)